jgi:hypothetical protein
MLGSIIVLMKSLNLSYPAILTLFGDYKVKGKTESQAFLAWFLGAYYRLDPTDVDDAICDSTNDKGVDGIYVNDLLQQVDVFQSRMGTVTPLKGLGDKDLKEFLGTLVYFNNGKSVRELSAATKSEDLRKLLTRLEIARLIDSGYAVHGVFLTNRVRDHNAITIQKTASNLELFDGLELQRQYLPINKAEPIRSEISFDISRVDVLRHRIEDGVELTIAPVLASELVRMDGIANQKLFAWNLRYQLKRSPVNKEIDKSILDTKEHRFFPAFHNGLTILAARVREKNQKLTISGYAVVNGCQSLNALYSRKDCLTRKLRILTKFVSVSPKSALAAKITDHTNRQNSITGRDLQSNSLIQTRLQTEVHTKYKGQRFYRIARGECPKWDQKKVIENDAAARVLLAFDLKQPESCHQNYKLFDDLHAEIFGRPEVNADRIVALMEIDDVIANRLPSMENKAFSGYTLTRFFFHYLLREVLELPESGDVKFWLDTNILTQEKNWRPRLRQSVEPIVLALMNTVDGWLKQPANATFDHKKDLKSPTKIKELRSVAIPFYQMAIQSKVTKSFAENWKGFKVVASHRRPSRARP